MNWLLRIILCSMFFCPSYVWAGGCYSASYRSSYSYPSYNYPTYTPIPVATFYQIPLFSVSYIAPPAPVVATPAALPVAATATTAATTAGAAVTTAAPAESSCEARAKALEARLVTLEKLLAQPSPATASPATQPAGATAPAGASHGQAVLTSHCAACHGAAAKEKGKGLTLFNGTALVPLTAKQTLKIIGQVNSARMPPPDNKEGIPPLTDQEVADVIGYLEAVPTAADPKQP